MSEDFAKEIQSSSSSSDPQAKPIAETVNDIDDYASNKASEANSNTNPSIVTILSIWNTMIGSSTVTMPNCVANAVFNMIFVSICYYTCRIVVKTGGNDTDYANTVKRYFGPKYGKIGRIVQILFNLAINVGATFIYFVTINQNLYPCIGLLLKLCGAPVNPEDITPSFTRFSLIYCGIIVCVLSFPLLILKEMAFLVKVNSLGIYFVSILLLFVMYTGVSSLFTTSFNFGYFKNADNEPRYLYLFGPDPSILMGTLSLGYFSHSFVLPMMKNNRNKSKNTRDLLLGYLCVMTTYVVVGSLGYIGFTGKTFRAQFEDNWFRFFESGNIVIIILRLISVFQLLSVLPVLFSIVRVQFFDTFFSSGEKDEFNNLKPYDPSKMQIVLFSSILCVLCLIVLYFFYNSLGRMLGFVGATTGLFLIYIIPLGMNYIYYTRRHYPDEAKLLEQLNKYREGEIPPTKENGTKHIDDFGVTEKAKDNIVKNVLFNIAELLLVLFGFFTVVIQFVHINFFGVVLKENPN